MFAQIVLPVRRRQPGRAETRLGAVIYSLVRFRHDIESDHYGLDLFFPFA